MYLKSILTNLSCLNTVCDAILPDPNTEIQNPANTSVWSIWLLSTPYGACLSSASLLSVLCSPGSLQTVVNGCEPGGCERIPAVGQVEEKTGETNQYACWTCPLLGVTAGGRRSSAKADLFRGSEPQTTMPSILGCQPGVICTLIQFHHPLPSIFHF